jgi:hypothetical protein
MDTHMQGSAGTVVPVFDFLFLFFFEKYHYLLLHILEQE